MKYDTQLGSALRRAGLDAARETLASFVWDTLRETGGDQIQTARRLEAEIKKHEDWLAELCQSYVAERAKDQRGDPLRRESDGGHNIGAKDGQRQPASTPPATLHVLKQDEAERLFDSAKTDHGTRASAGDGGGHISSADKGQGSLAPASPPARRNPGKPRRPVSAMAGVQTTMHRSCLDSYKVRDGRAIGDVLYKELSSLEAQNREEAYVQAKIRTHMANASPSHRVRDIISEQTLERYIAQAREVSRDE